MSTAGFSVGQNRTALTLDSASCLEYHKLRRLRRLILVWTLPPKPNNPVLSTASPIEDWNRTFPSLPDAAVCPSSLPWGVAQQQGVVFCRMCPAFLRLPLEGKRGGAKTHFIETSS